MDVCISYDAAPNRLRRILMEVLTRHPQIMQQRKQEVRIKSFGDQGVVYQLRFWVNNYALENKIKSDIYSHIWYRLRREKIHIPYPVREVIQTQPPEQITPTNVIEEVLEAVELFQPLGEAARKTLAQRARIQLYGAHEEIVQQGAPGHSLYIIMHGSCRVFVWTDKDTSPRPVAALNPGDFFGEMSLLTGAPRRATVVAKEETECLLIDKADVKDLLLAKPEVAQDLSRALAERHTALKSIADAKGPEDTETSAAQILSKIWAFFKT
jgi:CRP-like cAMP-binding protein